MDNCEKLFQGCVGRYSCIYSHCPSILVHIVLSFQLFYSSEVIAGNTFVVLRKGRRAKRSFQASISICNEIRERIFKEQSAGLIEQRSTVGTFSMMTTFDWICSSSLCICCRLLLLRFHSRCSIDSVCHSSGNPKTSPSEWRGITSMKADPCRRRRGPSGLKGFGLL